MDEYILSPLAPLSAAEPGGANLEYDELYLKLEELATPVPPSEMGESVIEGRDPDFVQLARACTQLWERTRDLRVAAYYTLAQVKLHGLDGLYGGLSTIKFLVDEMFERFYPLLDPDDDNDPTERVNILQLIAPPPLSLSDSSNVLTLLRNLKLGPRTAYTYRDYLLSSGQLDSPNPEDVPDSALFNAEMRGEDGAEMRRRAQLCADLLTLCDEITTRFNEQAGTLCLTLASLERELKQLQHCYEQICALTGAATAAETAAAASAATSVAAAPESAADPKPAAQTSAPAAPVAPAAGAVGPITDFAQIKPSNRTQALQLLQAVCDYFTQAEPNSPIPFLIQRAQRMAHMNFIELLGEIDSSAQERGREQLGVREQSSSDDNTEYFS